MSAGAVQPTSIAPLTTGAGTVATTVVGAPGRAAGAGVTLVVDDHGLAPFALMACTRMLYVVLLVRPVIVHEVTGGVAVHDGLPVVTSARYDVMGDPPSLMGATHCTVA